MTIDNRSRIWAQMKSGAMTTGDIVIEPDGSFRGKIHSKSTLAILMEMLHSGQADGVKLVANTIPVYPREREVFYGPDLPTDLEVINKSARAAALIMKYSEAGNIDAVIRTQKEFQQFRSLITEDQDNMAIRTYTIGRERHTKGLEKI